MKEWIAEIFPSSLSNGETEAQNSKVTYVYHSYERLLAISPFKKKIKRFLGEKLERETNHERLLTLGNKGLWKGR